ncbi:hypothetical protein MLD38_030431 [Melastoma candidum]|uniref:Uncharacterized protein n=1 Tax=Melastoma candidum TaxID=119954 RepID=A0ACB9MNI2_9MYRT|nr:hypothetical protein MLD38_030431 [Melastoma candidum]
MEEDSVPLTAFNVSQGMFEWLVMSFGLKNAPGIFQCKMDNAFKQVRKFCWVYIDDVLVYNQNEDNYMRHLDKTCKLKKERLNYKVIAEKIVEFPDMLEDRKQVQRFCGFVNYVRKFVKDLSQDLGRISWKTSSTNPWSWEDYDTQAIQRINSVMVRVALPYLYAGFVDILEIDRLEPEQSEPLPHLVKFILGCLGYRPKYVTTLITSTMMEEDEYEKMGKLILPNMQVWDIHPSETRHLIEPQRQDLDHRILWRKYYKDKIVRKAIKVEFLKDVLEHILAQKDKYYVFSDGMITVTIVRSYLSYGDEQAGERGWERSSG